MFILFPEKAKKKEFLEYPALQEREGELNVAGCLWGGLIRGIKF